MNKIAHRIIDLIEIYLRRGQGGKFVGFGVACLLGGRFWGNIEFNSVSVNEGLWSLALEFGGGTWLLSDCAGILLIAVGLCLIWVQHRKGERKSILIVELRGLAQTVDTPLSESLPRRFEGRRETILVDVRDRITNNQRSAIQQVNLLPEQIRNHVGGRDRRDLTICAGSIAAVPLTFQAGCLLSSEASVCWFEWGGNIQRWVEVQAQPQPQPPHAGTAMKLVGAVAGEEAVLALPVTYPISETSIARSFPGLPVFRLEGATMHLRDVPQPDFVTAITVEFTKAIQYLQRHGVKTIHLLLAAPGVVTLRLGAAYSPRNMPAVIVYQYSGQAEDRYSWGVRLSDSITGGEYVDAP